MITSGTLILLAATILIFLGLAQRVLARMRLDNRTAMVLVALLLAGSYLPDLRIAPGIAIDAGGTLIPIGVAVYLVWTADTRIEKIRAVVAAYVTGAAIFALDWFLPGEPGFLGIFDLDPLYVPAVAGAAFGYLAGRSRRAAFVAGTMGVVLTDLFTLIYNLAVGTPAATAAIGGAGLIDAVVIAGVFAVVLAEIVGETREFLARKAGREARPFDEAPTPSALVLYSAVVISTLLIAASVYWGPSFQALPRDHIEGVYSAIVDKQGNLVTFIGRRVAVGDEYIDEGNSWYRVVDIDGDVAIAEALGVIDLRSIPPGPQASRPAANILDLFRPEEEQEGNREPGEPPAPPQESRPVSVGVYFTHNDESYVPSDGTSSVYGRGGVHDVGRNLARTLESRGFQVDLRERLHLPHDRGAYRRSRRTVAEVLPERPDALFDVHRDAAPRAFYQDSINGKAITQIRFVVGRQNETRWANLQFAKDLKAIADEKYPGLVKGIFFGRGNYNQDVGPRTILLEFGAHTNPKEAAIEAAGFFADVVETYFSRVREK